jgi:hypothetical protein
MLGALQQMGSNGSGLSLRQNNRGASYFRLESSPRQGAPQVPDTTQAPVAPAVTLSFDLSTELYNRLDDMVRYPHLGDVTCFRARGRLRHGDWTILLNLLLIRYLRELTIISLDIAT